MFAGLRRIALGTCLLGSLAACGSSSSSYSYTNGVVSSSVTTPATTNKPVTGFTSGATMNGSNNKVAAQASTPEGLSVTVGASQTVSIAFTAVDSRTITGFGISDSLSKLPAGWAGPKNFVCATVVNGSGCVLNLTYTPTVVESGTLHLDYIFVDNAGMPRTGYAVTLPYVATAHNNASATVSPVGQINAVTNGGDQTVTVNFTTDDGNAVTALSVTTNLATLPSGWSATTPSPACAVLSTGNGCQLTLNYRPTDAGSGVLALTYTYTDDAGTMQNGTVAVPYAAIARNSVTASVSPVGQVNAVRKSGGQSVPVTFTTDDGKAASAFHVTTDLKTLPAGWSSAATVVACGSVSSGNGCQVPLHYSPSTLAGGTLALTYAYQDSSGVPRSGLVNIDYAATTDDNAVASPTPSGQIVAVVGVGSQALAVAFTSDDARSITEFTVKTDLGQLPDGWSSTAASFACSGIDADNVCRLPLLYTPNAAGAGTLVLAYSYKNNAGLTKTGTLNIPYRATSDNNIAGTPSPAALSVVAGSGTAVDVTFATDDANLATSLVVTAGLDALPDGWSATAPAFVCASVINDSTCHLALQYAPSAAAQGTLTLTYGYVNNAGFPKTGSVSIDYTALAP